MRELPSFCAAWTWRKRAARSRCWSTRARSWSRPCWSWRRSVAGCASGSIVAGGLVRCPTPYSCSMRVLEQSQRDERDETIQAFVALGLVGRRGGQLVSSSTSGSALPAQAHTCTSSSVTTCAHRRRRASPTAERPPARSSRLASTGRRCRTATRPADPGIVHGRAPSSLDPPRGEHRVSRALSFDETIISRSAVVGSTPRRHAGRAPEIRARALAAYTAHGLTPATARPQALPSLPVLLDLALAQPSCRPPLASASPPSMSAPARRACRSRPTLHLNASASRAGTRSSSCPRCVPSLSHLLEPQTLTPTSRPTDHLAPSAALPRPVARPPRPPQHPLEPRPARVRGRRDVHLDGHELALVHGRDRVRRRRLEAARARADEPRERRGGRGRRQARRRRAREGRRARRRAGRVPRVGGRARVARSEHGRVRLPPLALSLSCSTADSRPLAASSSSTTSSGGRPTSSTFPSRSSSTTSSSRPTTRRRSRRPSSSGSSSARAPSPRSSSPSSCASSARCATASRSQT